MDKPWLSRYPSDVPEQINPDQYPSLVEMFEQSIHKYADQPAFVNMGSVMTFRKLEERSRAFAAYLQNELKLQKGDRVAIMMPNLLQYQSRYLVCCVLAYRREREPSLHAA